MTNIEFNCDHNCDFSKPSKAHLWHHIINDIPTKINYGQPDLLPNRTDFLNHKDAELKPKLSAHIATMRPSIFMPNDVVEKNDWAGRRMKYRVYLFGVLPCGSKTCAILDDIDVFVDVAVPTELTP